MALPIRRFVLILLAAILLMGLGALLLLYAQGKRLRVNVERYNSNEEQVWYCVYSMNVPSGFVMPNFGENCYKTAEQAVKDGVKSVKSSEFFKECESGAKDCFVPIFRIDKNPDKSARQE